MRVRAILLSSILLASGCATTTRVGSAIGKIADGDRKTMMTGGLISGSIGEGLSSRDRRKALEAEFNALQYSESGQTVRWTGSRSGDSGEVVPGQPYRVGSQDCRQYTHTVSIDGAQRSARGAACRNADGTWASLS